MDTTRLARIRETLHPTRVGYCAEPLDIDDARWLLEQSKQPDWWVPSSKYLEPPYVTPEPPDLEATIAAWNAGQGSSGWRLDE